MSKEEQPTNEKESYKLTEQGEAYAISLLGGQDIANVIAGIQQFLAKNGDIFGRIHAKGDVNEWLLIATIVKLLQPFYDDVGWKTTVKIFEHMLEETDYFKTFPHADVQITNGEQHNGTKGI